MMYAHMPTLTAVNTKVYVSYRKSILFISAIMMTLSINKCISFHITFTNTRLLAIFITYDREYRTVLLNDISALEIVGIHSGIRFRTKFLNYLGHIVTFRQFTMT